MAEHQLPKLTVRVRFPSSAPTRKPWSHARSVTRAEIENRAYPVAVPSTCPELRGLPRFSSWTMTSSESAIARSRVAVRCW
jgi:hypothetical protein